VERFAKSTAYAGLVLAVLLLAGGASASSFYISSSQGSDSNPGSKQSPWAHAPGMASCTATCGNYTPRAGDQFIFYGGDTWGSSNFQLNIHWSGTNGNNVVYGGEDTGWYNSGVCGSSYCRPIFDFQNVLICTGGQLQYQCAGVLLYNASYVTIDNLELKNFEMPNQNTQVSGYGSGAISVWGSGSDYPTISNNYLHDWSMSGPITSGSSGTAIIGGGNGSGTHWIVNGNTLSDANAQCGCVIGAGINGDGTITNNICAYVDDCVDTYAAGTVIAGNLMHDLQDSTDPANHGNSIHAMCAAYIHDNIIYNMAPGVSGDLNEPRNSSCLATTTQNYYTWNNVMFNLGNQTCFEDENYNSGVTVNYYHYNDTCVPPGTSPGTVSSFAVVSESHGSGPGPNSITVVNMHVISNTGVSGTAPFIATASNSGSCCMNPPNGATVTTSVGMTPSTAASQGYTAANNYSPSSNTGSSVTMQGTNMTGNCSAVWTTLCIGLDSSNPTLPGTARPTVTNSGQPSTYWNVGAYQYSGSNVTQPVAPTGLTATLN
jgi:hypothetical protein